MNYKIEQIKSYSEGKFGSATVKVEDAVSIRYRIVRRKSDGKTFAFPPSEKDKNGKEFKLVWFANATLSKEVSEAVAEEFDKLYKQEEAPF